MSRYAPILVLLLGIASVVSGMAVSYSKYLNRKYFVQLQQVRSERDELEIAWNRLQLEESALATYPRIEAKARAELSMYIPRVGEAVVVREP
jgi:cell division protein FtsL